MKIYVISVYSVNSMKIICAFKDVRSFSNSEFTIYNKAVHFDINLIYLSFIIIQKFYFKLKLSVSLGVY